MLFRKMIKYLYIEYRLLIYISLVLLFLEILKKALKMKKKSSENDQLQCNWSFSELFYLLFFVPPTLNLKKNPVNQLIKKFWPKPS